MKTIHLKPYTFNEKYFLDIFKNPKDKADWWEDLSES